MARTKVFVSYSRHDEALVKPLAGLLGVAAEDAVFLDVASIEPGAKWKDTIDGALRESSVFVLCWCCEAEKSQFIGHEIALALAGGRKRLVPVLFCSTPLPASLSDYQWIDLRTQIRHSCSHGDRTATSAFAAPPGAMPAPAAAPKAAKASKVFLAAIAAAIALAVAFVGLSLLSRKGRAPEISESSRGGSPTPMASVQSPRPQPTIRVRKKSASEGGTAENKAAGEVEPAPIPASDQSDTISGVIVGAIAAVLALLGIGLMIRRARKKKIDQITAAASAYFHGLKTGS